MRGQDGLTASPEARSLAAPVLVTGAAGFVGSHLVRRLLTFPLEVHALVRPGTAQARTRDLGPNVHPLELTDGPAVRALFERLRPRTVLHLAADTRVERHLDLLLPQLSTNVLAGGHVLDAALRQPLQRLVWVGTCEEYGDGVAPFREEQSPRPVSPYSATRLAGTLMAQSLGRTLGAPVVAIRPFLIYGPGMHASRFVMQALDSALSGRPLPMTPGEQTRDLVWVEDVVDGLIRAAGVPGIDGELLNLASGAEVSLRALAEQIFALVGTDLSLIQAGALPYRAGESMHFFGDPSRAREKLGWTASTSLPEGLRRLLGWRRGQLL